MQIKKHANESQSFSKIDNIYNLGNRVTVGSDFKFKNKISYKAFLNSRKYGMDLTTPYLYADDYFLNPSQINLSNFDYYNNLSSVEVLEESYDNIKNLKLIYNTFNKNSLLNLTNFVLPSTYTSVLDSFRPSSEENN
jgi:hypothetical protein